MPARPRWAGSALALAGILLVALNVRTAVSSLSPIVHRIVLDIPLDSVALGVIGSLPPIAFAAAGIVTPWIARRVGLDLALVLACLAMIVGPVLRATANGYPMLIVGSALALLGMGLANVLLPPAVKRYFPDRIGTVTAAYVTLLAVSTAIAAALAEPAALAAGWRVSIGMWGVLAAVALVPWVLLAIAAHRAHVPPEAGAPPVARLRGLHRSRVAVAIALVFLSSALTMYAMFAWLPAILVEHAGVGEVAAGSLLAVFSIGGLPMGLIVPVLAARMRNAGLLIQIGAVVFGISMLGLALAPSAAVAWTVIAGLGGGIIFPTCLVLINLRTRSHEGSIALSGFVQSIGYLGGALGPIGVGVLHDLAGGWTAPVIAIAAIGLLCILPSLALMRPRFVEDDLAR